MFLASDVIVCDMIDDMQPMISVLYYAMDALSSIDFLCALATYSELRDTCRPSFGESFSISQGRHPILDWADTEKTITNDTVTMHSIYIKVMFYFSVSLEIVDLVLSLDLIWLENPHI